MNLYEAILIRRSWRTYNGLRLDETALSSFKEIIEEENSSLASLPLIRDRQLAAPRVVLLEDESLNGASGTYGFIRGARHFLVLVSGPTQAQMIEAGLLLERIILHATEQGLDTCWLGGTFSRTKFGLSAGLAEGEEVVAVSPLGHRSPNTRFAERMMQKLAKSSSRRPFTELFSGVNAPDLSVLTRPVDMMSDREKISAVFEMVRHAPSSRNSQPWRGEVSYDTRYARLHTDLHNRLTPLDMGIALSHFLAASEHLGMKWITSYDAESPDITFNFQRLD